MENSTTEPFNTANSNAMLGAVRFRSHEAQKVNNLFEKYLNQKYNYKGSLSDFVFKKFGGEAHEFLKKLI